MRTFGSLFAGIGGIDLGLERAGWAGRWQVEYEPFCQRVLAKHWPDVTRYGDIYDVDWGDVEPVDLIAGGFPCQPWSNAGQRKGLADDRWLWPEFERCIRELRPRYVLVENVPGLLVGGGIDAVLGGLAALGYDTEWESIPASAVGAPHLRYRVWIIAYRTELAGTLADGDQSRPRDTVRTGRDAVGYGGADVAYADGLGQGRTPTLGSSGLTGLRPGEAGPEPDGAGDGAVAYATSEGWRSAWDTEPGEAEGWGPFSGAGRSGWWESEPDVGRVAHGVPARVDRLRSLGNAVVPQVVEFIGRRIIEAEEVTA